jgi:CubicO group peptidase (beta-lactamase class C family)
MKMNQVQSLLLIIAVATSGLGLPAPAKGDELADRLNTYVKASADHLRFNGAVLVKHEGQVLLSRGMGLANFEHEVPVTPATKFRIGSITKQFAAMLILQQVQAGRIKLEDPINQYLADPPEAWQPVTVHHLLCHTGGIFNFTDSPEYLVKQTHLGRPEKEVLAMFRDKPLRFAPGEKHEYSNSGYILLGLILEKITGKKFEVVLKENILDPAGMKDSGYDRPLPVLEHRAQGYSRHNGVVHNAIYIDMHATQAAGAIYSTVEDMARWDDALREHKLLSAELTEKMFAPVLDNYGYGFVIDNVASRRQVWHNGGINGFHSMYVHCPQTRSCTVVLSNFEDGPCDQMGRELMSILMSEPYALPRTHQVAQVDPACYDALVGKYQLAPGVELTITRDDKRLQGQLTGQPKIELFPESETEFFLKVVYAQLSFVKDDAGKVTHVILHQGGTDQRGARMAEIEKAAGGK